MDNNMREKLETLPLTVLKEFAKDKKLKNVSTLRKKELIEALIEADKAERESEVQADKKIVSSSAETERGTKRQHIEKRNPLFLKRWHHPFGTDDLFFSFTCINPMFCKKHVFFVHITSQTGKKTSITGADCMVYICLRHFCPHQIQHREQH